MKVLVTGGAGYVGSAITTCLIDSGIAPVVLDDLSTGHAQRLEHVDSYVGDIADTQLLHRIFAEHPDICVAVHCAARKTVDESLEQPLAYYRDNVGKALHLVDGLLAHGCDRLIFSSSAAVYGDAATSVVSEGTPTSPNSPYAASKVMVERMLDDIARASTLRALSLRYFNPVGSDPHRRVMPYSIPPLPVLDNLVSAWQRDEPFAIFGTDWDTSDGTPVRDFVHVWDVARAHVAAVRWLVTDADGAAHRVVNVGSGHATTIRQLAELFALRAGRPVNVQAQRRRPGDTRGTYAAIGRAAELFDWQPNLTLADAIDDALAWLADPTPRRFTLM
jgi:UDP-glucose 4-epimerase